MIQQGANCSPDPRIVGWIVAIRLSKPEGPTTAIQQGLPCQTTGEKSKSFKREKQNSTFGLRLRFRFTQNGAGM
jgi:hypothetical protein